MSALIELRGEVVPTELAPAAPTAPDETLLGWLGRWWVKAVKAPLARFIDGVLLRRQWERFFLVFGGHIFFQTLRTSVQLGLFDLLARTGPLTRAEIARELGLEEQPTRVLLLGLVVSKVLKKRGARYANTAVARVLFCSSSPRNINAYVELQHRVMYPGLSHLLESVRQYKNVGLEAIPGSEPTLYERLTHDSELEGIFQDAMQQLSVQANGELSRFADLRGVRNLLDVGGGDGTNILALARRWPNLHARVFDSATVCAIAEKNLAASEVASRVGATPGDCFTTPFPRGIDCVLFAHFFTIWGEEKGKALLRKTFDALPPGGKVMIFNMMQRDDEQGPMSAAVGSPYFLAIATGTGMLFTWAEYERWLADCGFTNITRSRLPREHGLIVAEKPT